MIRNSTAALFPVENWISGHGLAEQSEKLTSSSILQG